MIFRKEKPTKLFFATDIHGSEKCWKKLVNSGNFYDVDIIILGGDITGKGIQALLEVSPGVWQTEFLGEDVQVDNQDSLENLEDRIRTTGFYPYRIKPEQLGEFRNSEDIRQNVFEELVTNSVHHWVELAETKLKGTGKRIIVTAGNDDPLFVNELFMGSSVIMMAERKVINLDDHHEMINEGYSNPTPWNTHREMDEESLFVEIEKQINQVKKLGKCYIQFTCPTI